MKKRLHDIFNKLENNPPTLLHGFDNILQRIELLPPQDWSNIEVCFIISTGRTGTKFLGNFFGKFENVLSVHEPDPTFRNLSIKFAKGRCSFNSAKEVIEVNRRAMCRKVKRNDCKVYIESNPRMFSLIKPLIEVFSKPKIVHIVRDGRDFVRSGMSRYYGRFYSDDDPYPRLKACDFPDDDYYEGWEELSDFEKISWYWKKRDQMIYKDIEGYSNSITVRFEDIFYKTKEYDGLKEICKFLGLDENKSISIFKSMQENNINASKDYGIPHWTKWDKKRKEMFDRIAGDHMKKYYDY